MKTQLNTRELKKGLLLLMLGCGLGINGDHSTLTMLLLCWLALKGMKHVLHGMVHPTLANA